MFLVEEWEDIETNPVIEQEHLSPLLTVKLPIWRELRTQQFNIWGKEWILNSDVSIELNQLNTYHKKIIILGIKYIVMYS